MLVTQPDTSKQPLGLQEERTMDMTVDDKVFAQDLSQ